MKLKNILESVLKEEQDQADTVEFPANNFHATFIENEKKIVLSPIRAGSHSTKTRTFVNLIKQNFKVQSVLPKKDGVFELKLDPFEKFYIVKDFIIQKSEKDAVS